jgi:hypothetical protein
LSLGGSLISGNAQATQQINAYNQRVNAANAEADAINKSTIFTYAMNNLKGEQIENQADVEEEQARDKLYATSGEATATATSSGITGNSVADLLESYRVATGKDISGIGATASGQLQQVAAENKGTQMGAQNQILGLKEGIGLAPDTSTTMLSNIISGVLGVGKAYMDNTAPITDKSQQTGGLFGGGGFLGAGRQFG